MKTLIKIVPLLLACQSCSILPSSDSTSDIIEANNDSIEAVKAIDSYYLVPCRKPEKATSDDMAYILDYIDQLIVDYSDCYKRHNSLIPQLK